MTSDPAHAPSSAPDGAPIPPRADAHRDAGGTHASRHRAGHGSWLLASAAQRMAAAVLVSAVLWGLTGWAMGWW
jgi:hypothetical protein